MPNLLATMTRRGFHPLGRGCWRASSSDPMIKAQRELGGLFQRSGVMFSEMVGHLRSKPLLKVEPQFHGGDGHLALDQDILKGAQVVVQGANLREFAEFLAQHILIVRWQKTFAHSTLERLPGSDNLGSITLGHKLPIPIHRRGCQVARHHGDERGAVLHHDRVIVGVVLFDHEKPQL